MLSTFFIYMQRAPYRLGQAVPPLLRGILISPSLTGESGEVRSPSVCRARLSLAKSFPAHSLLTIISYPALIIVVLYFQLDHGASPQPVLKHLSVHVLPDLQQVSLNICKAPFLKTCCGTEAVISPAFAPECFLSTHLLPLTVAEFPLSGPRPAEMCYERCNLAVSQALRLKLLSLTVGKGPISRSDGRGSTQQYQGADAHGTLQKRHL